MRKDRIILKHSQKSTWSRSTFELNRIFFRTKGRNIFFPFLLLEKCVASCNRKQNVHNTPSQVYSQWKGIRLSYTEIESCLERYLAGVVILITAFALSSVHHHPPAPPPTPSVGYFQLPYFNANWDAGSARWPSGPFLTRCQNWYT